MLSGLINLTCGAKAAAQHGFVNPELSGYHSVATVDMYSRSSAIFVSS